MLAYAVMSVGRADDSLTDVPGFRVGHATDTRGLTGCTVILCGAGAVVATNARLAKIETCAVARLAQTAYAYYISPVGTRFDGDVIFCLSRGDVSADPLVVGMLAIGALQEAILRAVMRARGLPGLPTASDLDTE